MSPPDGTAVDLSQIDPNDISTTPTAGAVDLSQLDPADISTAAPGSVDLSQLPPADVATTSDVTREFAKKSPDDMEQEERAAAAQSTPARERPDTTRPAGSWLDLAKTAGNDFLDSAKRATGSVLEMGYDAEAKGGPSGGPLAMLLDKWFQKHAPEGTPQYRDAADQVAQLGYNLYKGADIAIKQRATELNLAPDSAKDIAKKIGDTVLNVIPLVATSAAGPEAPLSLLFAQGTAEHYERARDKGVSAGAAATESAALGSLETLTMAVPLRVMTAGDGTLLEHVVNSSAAFGAQSGVVTALEQAYEARKISAEKGVSFTDAWNQLGGWDNVKSEAETGAAAGAILGGGHRIAEGGPIKQAAKQFMDSVDAAQFEPASLTAAKLLSPSEGIEQQLPPLPNVASPGAPSQRVNVDDEGPPPATDPTVLTPEDHQSPVGTDLIGQGKTFIKAAAAKIRELIPGNPAAVNPGQENVDVSHVSAEDVEQGRTAEATPPLAAEEGAGGVPQAGNEGAAVGQDAGNIEAVTLRLDGTPWKTKKGAALAAAGRVDDLLEGQTLVPVEVDGGWGLKKSEAAPAASEAAVQGRPPQEPTEAPVRSSPAPAAEPREYNALRVRAVHEAADKAGIPWNGDQEFMRWSKDLTGKEHLDDMTGAELEKVRAAIEAGEVPVKSAPPAGGQTAPKGPVEPKGGVSAATEKPNVENLEKVPEKSRFKPSGEGGADALTVLAAHGGIRDDEGHDLLKGRNLQKMVPRQGPLIRAKGMSIDQAGELLHQHGFFGPPDESPRPTERQVLDLIEQGHKSKVYTPDLQSKIEEDRAGQREADDQKVAMKEARQMAKEQGHVFSEEEFGRIVDIMRGQEVDAQDAIDAYLESNAAQVVHEGNAVQGQHDADVPFEPLEGGEGAGQPRPEPEPPAKPAAQGEGGGGARAPPDEAGRPNVEAAAFGADNKIFTADAAEKARQRLRDKFKNQLNAGLDPEMMLDGLTLGGYYIEGGARSFGAWARKMLDDLGESAKPYLRAWYESVRHYPGVHTEGLTSAADIEAKPLEAHIADDVSATRPSVERPGQAPGSSDAIRAPRVSAGSAPNDAGVGEGQPAAPGSGGDGPVSEIGVPASSAAPVGEGGNRPARSEASDAGERPTERGGRGGGGLAGLVGPRVGRIPTGAIGGTSEGSAAAVAGDHRSIPIKEGDRANIDATLPELKPEQRDDVHKIEQRFQSPDGHGMLITNGTGTGKTYTGGGTVARAYREKGDGIFVLAPTQDIASEWVKTLAKLGVPASTLENTQTAGKGVVVTTYANFGANRHLVDREWHLGVADESHYLMSSASSTATAPLATFRALTYHPQGYYDRARMILRDEYDKLDQLRDAKGRLTPEGEAMAGSLFQKTRDLAESFQGKERPKALFLSATPFSYHQNLDMAQGYLFDWHQGAGDDNRQGYNAGDNRARFYMQHFGYTMRYNKLTRPPPEVNTEVMERQFHERLKKEGSLWGRQLQVDQDYDRKFILVDDGIGTKIDQMLTFLSDADDGKFRPLAEEVRKQFDYLARSRLLEAIKAHHAIPIIKQHIALGRKVIVFHDYNEGGGFNPFEFSWVSPTDKAKVDLIGEFHARNPDALKMDFDRMRSPIETLSAAFPDALLYNGTVTPKVRQNAKALFNDDNSGRNLMVLQSAAGREGISLHDVTAKHQRVLINLGLPTRPMVAMQQEGRIYRVGQASDAAFRYMNTGTNWERYAFASKIAERVSTVDNLAMGNQARALKQSFIDAFLDSAEYPPGAEDGKGGKEQDRAINTDLSEWEKAKTYYFANQKIRGRRDQRQGVDYYPTPEPIGLKMVQLADIKPGDKVLEPSAGHGAIARFFPDDANRTLIEPSQELASKAGVNAAGAKVITDTFENHHVVNKYDAIVMNPPFGHGGKTSSEHLQKATQHLRDGGRIVMLLPRGGMAESRLDKWMDSDEAKQFGVVANIRLPSVVFERSGTSVASHILVIEKQVDPQKRARLDAVNRDYTNIDNISELFDRMENLDIPRRIEPAPNEQSVAAGQAEPPRPAASPAAATAPGETSGRGGAEFTTHDIKHGKTGAPLYVAAMSNRVERVEYDRLSSIAKRNGGFYSAFRGNGAVPGFQFKSDEARANFIRDAAPKYSIPETDKVTVYDENDQPVQADHYVVPGAEKDQGQSAKTAEQKRAEEMARLKVQQSKMRSGKTQQGAGPLFGGEGGDKKQGSLFDMGATPDFAAKVTGRVREQLADRLSKVDPTGKLAVQLVPKIEALVDGKLKAADGRYMSRLIEVSLRAKDKMATLDHEIIHGLRDLDLFRPAEWRALESAVKADRVTMAAIRKRYAGAGLSEDAMVEEAVADMHARWNRGDLQPKGFVRTALQRISDLLEAVRNWLSGNGFNSAGSIFRDIGKGEIGARDAGEPTAAEKFAAAWHGTPHDFDQFDSSKIGTGEGAQAYGHGLYFAGEKGVAEFYRDKLTHTGETYLGGKLVARDTFLGQGLRTLFSDMKLGKTFEAARDLAASDLKARARFEEKRGNDDQAQESLDAYNELRQLQEGDAELRRGRLFQVDLAPGDHEWLDWDKPINQQSPEVRAKLAPMLDEMHKGAAIDRARAEQGSGSDFYRDLAERASDQTEPAGNGWTGFRQTLNDRVQNQRAASEALSRAGVPGLRYLDQVSRNRPIREIKKAFLEAMPEDAEFDDVMEHLGDGTFTDKQEGVLRELQKNDWLGFDHPAQAISAALTEGVHNWDPTPELVKAVDALKEGGTNNYVVFDAKHVSITAKYALQDDAPESPEPPETPREVSGHLANIARATKEVREGIGDFLVSADEAFKMALHPMSAGSPEAQAAAKDFANAIRAPRFEGAELDKKLEAQFTPEERRTMFDAADQDNLALLDGREAPHVEALPPEQRDTVRALQRDANDALRQAKRVGLYKGKPMPSYVPHMMVMMADGKASPLPKGGMGGAFGRLGRNLTTSSRNLMQRKYRTVEEMEAAGQKIVEDAAPDSGGVATAVRDIRTLPHVTARLRQAVAGRALINSIRAVGKASGEEVVSEGEIPAGTSHEWFTLDHPSMRTWQPVFESTPEGKIVPKKDADGNIVFKQVPIYVRKEFKGPLKAVLSQDMGGAYNALMGLKGRIMSTIMWSPAIHNLVVAGKAFPAMPGKVLTGRVYRDGHQQRQDLKYMRQAILDGLAPIGGRGAFQDITSMMEMPNLSPGRSLTAKTLAFIPGIFSPRASDAVKRAIDKAGDVWHNKLLWDRVFDLQVGLYHNIRQQYVTDGFDPQTAGRIAAHLANRYAGSIPVEAMSKAARMVSNMLLFSRSFTLGNLGVFKDAAVGLPGDVRAQIARDAGQLTADRANSLMRRRATSTLLLDFALSYGVNAGLMSAAAIMMASASRDDFWGDAADEVKNQGRGYVKRIHDSFQRTAENPVRLLNPFRTVVDLLPQGENEPGKEDRILVGHEDDGTAIYMRQPTGKMGEDLKNWLTRFPSTLKSKLSPFAKPLVDVVTNDAGFGKKIYDPYAETPEAWMHNIYDISKHVVGGLLPLDAAGAVKKVLAGKGHGVDMLKVAGPLFGLTFSHGFPGGQAAGELHAAREERDFQIQHTMPQIREFIKNGDEDDARELMNKLEMSPREQLYIIKSTLNPQVSKTQRKEFMKHATEEERARYEDAEARAQHGGTSP